LWQTDNIDGEPGLLENSPEGLFSGSLFENGRERAKTTRPDQEYRPAIVHRLLQVAAPNLFRNLTEDMVGRKKKHPTGPPTHGFTGCLRLGSF
jgi:hypothetical protein